MLYQILLLRPAIPVPSFFYALSKPKTPTKMPAAWRADEVVGRRLHDTHLQTHLNQSSRSKHSHHPNPNAHRTTSGLVELSPGISNCHRSEIQGLCLQRAFSQTKNRDANPPTPLTMGTEQAHFPPPQGTSRAPSYPHSKGQVLYKQPTATSAAPAQTGFQGHSYPKAETGLSVVFRGVKHTAVSCRQASVVVLFSPSLLEGTEMPTSRFPVFPPLG